MRITLCVNKDIVGCFALNHFMEKLHHKHTISVILSDRLMQPKDRADATLDELRFFERDLLIEQFFPLLDTQPQNADSPSLRTFNGCAAHYGVPMQEVKQINSPEGVARFTDTQPDVILSVRYGYVFKEAIIATAAKKVLNIHSGILPRYRGVMPTFRTMLAGDSHAGITLHTVDDAGIDTGNVISISTLPIRTERSMLWHVMQLYPLAAEMADKALAQLDNTGTLPDAIPQDESEAQYFTFPTAEELQAFRDKGLKMVDRSEYLDWLSQFSDTKAQRMCA